MTVSDFSEELESLLFPYRAEYKQIVNGWIQAGTFGIAYPSLLVETFHYVKHSCSLMSYACARLGRSNVAVQTYLAEHIAEEVGHEEWVLNDLEKLGFERRKIETAPPLPETMSLVGNQLYVINYLHPAGLLGYIYIMESQPPSEESLRFLQEHFGITAKAMSFLIRHGKSDVKHRLQLRDMLNTHFVSAQEREAAVASAVMGLSNVNRLMARLRSGDYSRCLPKLISDEALDCKEYFRPAVFRVDSNAQELTIVKNQKGEDPCQHTSTTRLRRHQGTRAGTLQ